MDMLGTTESPQINGSYVVCISLDSLCGIVSGMELLVENSGSSDEEKQLYPDTVYVFEPEHNLKICREMATQAWPTLLGSLSLLLDKSQDETLTQEILKAYQTFTLICGTLQLTTPRDAFLTSLCKTTLPNNIPAKKAPANFLYGASTTEPTEDVSALSSKNVQSMKALFNIAHCMGNILKDGWALVLDTFQQLDRILHTTKGGVSSGTGKFLFLKNNNCVVNSELGQSHELSVLSASLDLLFRNTDAVEDEALMHIFATLISVSNNAILNNVKVCLVVLGIKC